MSQAMRVRLVTGIDDAAMSTTTMHLTCDRPDAVVVKQHIDGSTETLTHAVTSFLDVIERSSRSMIDDCTSCVTRNSLLDTLIDLAQQGWSDAIVQLPAGVSPAGLCAVLAHDDNLRGTLHLDAVIAALHGPTAADDLSTDDELLQRGTHISPDDDRGVAEVATHLVENADIVFLNEGGDGDGTDFARALARPSARLFTTWDAETSAAAHASPHDYRAVQAWCCFTSGGNNPHAHSPHVWTTTLETSRPFHPGRLYANIERLGGGWFRSRGSFWVPSRPGMLCEWDSAGGSLSIGAAGRWGNSTPRTRIVATGLKRLGDQSRELRAAFNDSLLTDEEMNDPLEFLAASEDGLEPWLGDIHQDAS